MANIPIKKLSEGSTSYYPLSVGESVVTTKDITVASDIGGYRKNDKIDKVTNLDVILNKLLGEEAAPIPGTVIDTELSTTSTNAVQNKVIKAAIDKKVEEYAGESRIWNETSGGGVMYTSASTGTKSFVGVNNPADSGGIAGQLYVVKGSEKTKLNMYDGKFCYVKGDNPSTEAARAKRELVVQEDLNADKLIEIVQGMTSEQKATFKEALGL